MAAHRRISLGPGILLGTLVFVFVPTGCGAVSTLVQESPDLRSARQVAEAAGNEAEEARKNNAVGLIYATSIGPEEEAGKFVAPPPRCAQGVDESKTPQRETPHTEPQDVLEKTPVEPKSPGSSLPNEDVAPNTDERQLLTPQRETDSSESSSSNGADEVKEASP